MGDKGDDLSVFDDLVSRKSEPELNPEAKDAGVSADGQPAEAPLPNAPAQDASDMEETVPLDFKGPPPEEETVPLAVDGQRGPRPRLASDAPTQQIPEEDLREALKRPENSPSDPRFPVAARASDPALRRSNPSIPLPPPPSFRPPQSQPRTEPGLGPVPAPPSASRLPNVRSAPPAPPSSRGRVPAALSSSPSRPGLPAATPSRPPPPPAPSSRPKQPIAAPPSAKPAMDWDDEDEVTEIHAKENSSAAAQPRPGTGPMLPSAGRSDLGPARAGAARSKAGRSESSPGSSREAALAGAEHPSKSSSMLVVIALGLAGVFAIVAAAVYFTRPSEALLLVTASGPRDTAVENVKVFVDGELACMESPCRKKITPGAHTVRVEAPGFERGADRPIVVKGGADQIEHFQLVREGAAEASAPKTDDTAAATASAASPDAAPSAAPSAAPTPAAEAQPATESAAAATTPPVANPVQPAAPQPAKPASRPAAPATPPAAAQPATGNGTININSIPVSAVLVDGRPVGQTPTRASVPAGTHTVTFVHPEQGRRSVTVTVTAGGSATAAVRF
jgi:hypothetical protein